MGVGRSKSTSIGLANRRSSKPCSAVGITTISPGFIGARRFKVSGESQLPGRYVAIYELECTDPGAVLASLNARAGTPDMPISPALDVANVTIALLEPLTERLSAPRADA